jgi:septal ring-binding cell division protein DamX
MKNPFSKSSSQDKQQKGQQISSQLDTEQRWYCYADEANLDWRCSHEKTVSEDGTDKTSVDSYSNQPTDDMISPADETAQSSLQLIESTAETEVNPSAEVAMDSAVVTPGMVDDTNDSMHETRPAGTPAPEVPELMAANLYETPEDPVSEPVSVDTAQPAVEQPTNAQKVLDVPAGYYAVQLIAFNLAEEILAFAVSAGITDPVYVRIQSASSQLLYVLLEGIYQNRELADAGADEWFKANPRAGKPWVRSIEDLQTSMRKAAANE